jgi:hypothetical protein
MSMARIPRKLTILAWAATSICVSALLVAGAKPPGPQTTITSLAGSLAAVSAGSATDAWAVGETRTQKPLALHWNGTSWAQVPTPAPGAFGSFLSGVTEISPTNVWAVGSSNGSSGSTSLVLHWNGTRWAQVPTPSSGISGLSGVSAVAANDIWAVGSGGTLSRETTLVLHWDGSRWTRVPSPTPPGQIVALFAVSAVSANDVWAVGRDLTSTVGKTLVLHWDGTAWTQVPSPSPGADNQLAGVHMTSATDGWAVGWESTSLGGNLTLVLHWNGTAWTQVPSPTFGLRNGGSQLMAVSALTGSDAWASGLFNPKGAVEGTLLLHWNGTAWTRVTAPSPSPGGATGGSGLTGVDMVASADVWSAGLTFDGTGKERTLLLHWNGTTWTRF